MAGGRWLAVGVVALALGGSIGSSPVAAQEVYDVPVRRPPPPISWSDDSTGSNTLTPNSGDDYPLPGEVRQPPRPRRLLPLYPGSQVIVPWWWQRQ